MSKFELAIAKDYVADWGLTDATRELFQNALDQETTEPDNSMFKDYDEDREVFIIGNKKSVLKPSTLLMGSSSKRDDDETIGKFGEGYKIATLVLLRLGKTVTFYNYGAKEVWRPRFVKSRRYGGAELLTFFVDKKHIWQSVPDNNLTIEIGNISEEEWFEIGETNLHMQEGYGHWVTEFGNILLDEDLKGKVFVNGLYVCTVEDMHYGYDIKPQYIKLDRDRRLVPNFELKWLTSRMWAEEDKTGDHDEKVALVTKMSREKADDVRYISSSSDLTLNYRTIASHAHDEFKREYGDNAVPVSSQDESERLGPKHKPIIVEREYKELVTASPEYVEPDKDEPKSLRDRVIEWMKDYSEDITHYAYDELHAILEEYDE